MKAGNAAQPTDEFLWVLRVGSMQAAARFVFQAECSEIPPSDYYVLYGGDLSGD
jgi:hypothetical protein